MNSIFFQIRTVYCVLKQNSSIHNNLGLTTPIHADTMNRLPFIECGDLTYAMNHETVSRYP